MGRAIDASLSDGKSGVILLLCLGCSLTCFCSPTTSVLACCSIGAWHAVPVFFIAFSACLFLLKREPSVFKNNRFILGSVVLYWLGAAVDIIAWYFELDAMLYASAVVIGCALRGFAIAPVMMGWAELLVDYSPRRAHVSIVLPASLAFSALLGLAVGLSFGTYGLIATMVSSLVFSISAMLLGKTKATFLRCGFDHVSISSHAEMPRSTHCIIATFGIALGATWALLGFLGNESLFASASASYLLVSAFLFIGIKTFMPRRELEFGFAMRWVFFLTMAAFLFVPILHTSFPGLTAGFLALAWAAQVLLFALMPVKMASSLPVSLFSVCSSGSVSYALGALLGYAAVFIVMNDAYLRFDSSVIVSTAVCLVLSGAILMFPSKMADASVLGLRTHEDRESRSQRLRRRSDEVATRWSLTPREREVMYRMVLGENRSQIAEALCVSEETVKTHGKHIYKKLGVHSLRALVSLVENGTSPEGDFGHDRQE